MAASEEAGDIKAPAQQEKEPVRRPKTRYYTRARILRRLLLLFGLYIGLCAALAWQIVRPRSSGFETTPEQYRVAYENVAFRSADGTPLSGWFIPAVGRTRGVIVFCHGINGNRETFLSVAMDLHRQGYAGLLFDFRGRGQSGGRCCTIGYRETDDLLAAIHYVKSRPAMQNVPLGVLGHSQGGAVAIMGTARCPDVQAVIAESPFAQLDHAVANHFRSSLGSAAPLIGIPTRWIGERLIGTCCADIAPVREIKRLAPRPLLLIQDADDTLCPPEETRALYAAAGEPKTLWTVPHADHVQARIVQPGEYHRRVLAFFETNLHHESSH